MEYLAWLLTVVVCVMADGFFSAGILREASDVAIVSIEPNELFLIIFAWFHLLHALVIS